MAIDILDYALMAGNAYESTRREINQIPFPTATGCPVVLGQNRLS